MQQNIDLQSIGMTVLVLAMPFIAAFHVAQGAPWAFCTTLVEFICIGGYVYTNRKTLKETYVTQNLESQVREPVSAETPAQRPPQA